MHPCSDLTPLRVTMWHPVHTNLIRPVRRLCFLGLSSLPHMLRELRQRLGPFEPGCIEWRAAWAEWKDQVWRQEFSPPQECLTHDPVNRELASDMALDWITPKPNQWRLPVALPTDITEQYMQAMRDAASTVATVTVDTSAGFMDQEFPSGYEDLVTGYGSLFTDAEKPCADDWMNHPEAPRPRLNPDCVHQYIHAPARHPHLLSSR